MKKLFWDFRRQRSAPDETEETIQFGGRRFTDEELDQRWQTLLRRRAQNNPLPRRLPTAARWAAAVLLLVGLGLVGRQLQERLTTVQYATLYGESQTVLLPDGSRVVLNAHSTLRLRKAWNQEETREVWLEGEAFFEVEKKATPGGNVKFVVHASNLDVEVVGTQFNVQDRRGTTQVVLREGKVRLNLHAAPGKTPILMQPGELVEVAENAPVVHRQVEEKPYTAWKDHKLVFLNSPLTEVAQRLEDTYGIEVVLQGKTIRNRKLTGEVPSDQLDLLLKALEEVHNLKIARTDHQIILRE